MRKSLRLLGFLLLVSPLLPAQISNAKQRALALTHVTVIDTGGGPAGLATQLLVLAGAPSGFAKQSHVAPATGGRIAFDSDQSGFDEIYVINSDGSHEQRLTRASKDETNVGPAWSPDCRKIAFTKLWLRPKEHSQIYVMAANGTDLQPLGRPPQGANDWDPNWSPDGKDLAFISDRDGAPDIYAMRADGSGVRRLTHSKGPKGWSLNPAWSPNGDEIAFDANPTGIQEIYVLTIQTGQLRQLTHTASKGARCRTCEGTWTPAWSPDSKQILFSSNRDASDGKLDEPSQWGIYAMDTDGSHLHRVTYWDDAHAKWSPDGKRILFMSKRDGRKHYGLYVMNADGSSAQLITANQSDNRHANWCRCAAEAEHAPTHGEQTPLNP